MRPAWAIAKKEIRSLFVSPVAYAAIAVYLVINGFFFWLAAVNGAPASLEPISGMMSIILLLIAPLFTMRIVAEEYQNGTVELLYTSPITSTQIVLGKYLAILTLLAVLLGLTLQFPAFLIAFGAPDRGPMITGYLGIFLLGASLMAVGMFASSITSNQMIAGLLSFGILLMLWLIESAGMAAPQHEGFFKAISMPRHYDNFLRGVLNSIDVYFFLAVIAGFNFLTVKSLEARRG